MGLINTIKIEKISGSAYRISPKTTVAIINDFFWRFFTRTKNEEIQMWDYCTFGNLADDREELPALVKQMEAKYAPQWCRDDKRFATSAPLTVEEYASISAAYQELTGEE